MSQRVCVGGRLRHDTQRGHQTVPKTEGTAAPRSPKTERRLRARRAGAAPHPLAVSPGCPKIGCWPRVGCITPHGGCQVAHTVPVLCYNTDNPRRTLGEGAGRSRFSFFGEKRDGDLGLSAVSEVGRGQRSSLAPTSAQPMLSVLGKATLRLPARGPGGTELGKGSATGPGGPWNAQRRVAKHRSRATPRLGLGFPPNPSPSSPWLRSWRPRWRGKASAPPREQPENGAQRGRTTLKSLQLRSGRRRRATGRCRAHPALGPFGNGTAKTPNPGSCEGFVRPVATPPRAQRRLGPPGAARARRTRGGAGHHPTTRRRQTRPRRGSRLSTGGPESRSPVE